MRNSRINLNGEPKGVFMEGIISGTPLPGTIVTVKPLIAPVGGRFTWIAGLGAGSSNGDPRLQMVLTEDLDQGQLYSTAYVDGARCFLYAPLLGEEMNVLVGGAAGTGSADAHFIGDRFIVIATGASAGQLIATATSSVMAPWTCMEHIDFASQVAGLTWCMRS